MPDQAVEAGETRHRRPDLWDVLQVVRERPGDVTYVYANKLGMIGHRNATTSLVLRRLKRLEQLGYVERARTSYAVMIAWAPASTPPTNPHHPAPGHGAGAACPGA